MNRSELVSTLKDDADLKRKEAALVVDTFFSAIEKELAADGRVEIRGFGSFTVNHYKAYTGRNPKTGAKIQVPLKRLPFFKVGKALREMVDNHD